MNDSEKKFWKKAHKQRRPYHVLELGEMYDREDKGSARYNTWTGDTKGLRLIDRIIFPINICPNCGSEETFHARMQYLNIDSNVWRTSKVTEEGMIRFVKYDMCLSCHQEFFIEIYLWRMV